MNDNKGNTKAAPQEQPAMGINLQTTLAATTEAYEYAKAKIKMMEDHIIKMNATLERLSKENSTLKEMVKHNAEVNEAKAAKEEVVDVDFKVVPKVED